jgi:hypothetical protein
VLGVMVILLLEYLSNLKYRMSGSFLHHFQYTAPEGGTTNQIALLYESGRVSFDDRCR